MPMLASEFSCPRCKKVGAKSQILAGEGRLECKEKGSEHFWVDTEAFFNEKPVMEFAPVVPKNLPQDNHTTMTITLPVGIEQALSAKYGDKVNNTLASILQQMLEGEVLIIGKTDYDRLAGHLGKNPQSAGELVGMVFAMKSDVDEQKEIAERAAKEIKAYEGISPGMVLINLGAQAANVMDKAGEAGLPLKLFVERKFLESVENGWI